MAEPDEDRAEGTRAGAGAPAAADSTWLPAQILPMSGSSVPDAGPDELRDAATDTALPDPDRSPPHAQHGGFVPPAPSSVPHASAELPAVASPKPSRARRLSWSGLRKRSPARPSHTATGRRKLIGGALAALVLVGIVALLAGGATKGGTTSSSPQAIYRQLRTPFTSNGVRFEVQPATSVGWAVQIRRRAPRAGRRWVIVGVPLHNLSRPRLLPRSLGYRIVTPTGLVFGPELVEEPGGALIDNGSLAKDERSSVHLGFQVPKQARDLTLAFDAAGIRQPSVRVLLGAER